jgi:phenolic acid decarboxylase
MTNSIRQLEIFRQLIQEKPDLFVNYQNDLVSLKEQLTDNDEENIIIVDNWLQNKPEIRRKYNAKLHYSGSKGIADTQSNTKPGEETKSLKDTIKQALQVDEIDKSSSKTTPSA